VNFTIFHFFRKNEKTPETLDFTGFSGGVFGVPEVIRTPDLPLRSSKNLVFNRVPVCSVMSEKPWNIKDSG
jgi:hypothetical protein